MNPNTPIDSIAGPSKGGQIRVWHLVPYMHSERLIGLYGLGVMALVSVLAAVEFICLP